MPAASETRQKPRMEEADHAGREAATCREHRAERRVRPDGVIGDAVPPAGEPPGGDHAFHRLAVGARPVLADGARPPRASPDPRIVPRPGPAAPPRRVHHVQDDDLVAAMVEEPERLERQRAVEEQIGDENDEAPAPELVDHPPEGRLGRGALARLERAEGLEQPAPVGEPRARWQRRAHRVVERDESGGVTLALEDQRERGDEPLGVGELGQAATGSPSRPWTGSRRPRRPARRLVSSSYCFT